MNQEGRRVLAVALLVIFACVMAGAQVSTSRIVGTVMDKTGAVIAGAKVTITNQGTNVPLTTKTSASGAYSFESMQVGVYKITVEMEGFKTFISSGNVLTVGQPMTINPTLEVGVTSQQVEVSAAAEMVQTSSSGNLGNVVDNVSVTSLPIVGSRGRNPVLLVLLQPGVVSGGNTGGGTYVNGARDRAWNYTLDGVDMNENSTPGANFTPTRANPDMLQEFRVVTGTPTADLGSTSGGQVMMVTKSGTNNFHGNLFYLYQTPSFMANEPNNKIYAKPITRPQWVQKIPGGSLGGPIMKNKAFFFVNVQTLNTLQTFTKTATVYTQTARQGIIRYVSKNMVPGCAEGKAPGPPGAPTTGCPRNTAAGVATSSVDYNGNVVAAYAPWIGTYDIAAKDPLKIGLDPTTMKLINSLPLPNNFTVGDGLNTAGYTFVAPSHEKQVDTTFKIDYNFNERNQAFARISFGHQNTIGDNGNGGLQMYPTSYNLVDTKRRPRNFALNWRTTPTNSMTNELVAGMNRFFFGFLNGDPNAAKESPLVLNNVTMPTSNWSGNRRTLTTMQLSDNLKWTKGKHTLGFGTNLKLTRHIDDRGSAGNYDVQPSVGFGTSTSTGNPVDITSYQRPADINVTYDPWSSVINDMLGKVGAITEGFTSNGTNKWQPAGTLFNFESRFPSYQFYGQDDWKIKPNLTLNLGLRWEIYMSPYNLANTVLHPDQPVWLDRSATATNTLKWVPGKLFNNSLGNLGPSIGFAWDPFKDGKTSVRSAYRIAYDSINTFALSGLIFQNLPGMNYSYLYSGLGQAPIATGCPYVSSAGVPLCGGARLTSTTIPTLNPSAVADPVAMRQPAVFGTTGVTVMDPRWKPAKTDMWSFSIQHELPWKMVGEVNYIGHKATRLLADNDGDQVDVLTNGFVNDFNTVKAGNESTVVNQMLANFPLLKAGQTGSAYIRANYASTLANGDVASLAASLSALSYGGVQQLARAGMSPSYFQRFTQFGAIGVIDSGGWSNYNAFQAQIQRHFSNGLQFQFSYTFSKSLDTNSFDPSQTGFGAGNTQTAGNTLQDIYNRRLNYGLSDFDRTHALQGNFVIDLPFGKGRKFFNHTNGVIDRIIGGWQMSNIVTLQSGRPMTPYGGAYTISNEVRSYANCSGCSSDMGNPHWEGGDPYAGGTMYYFTPEQRAMFSTPAPGQEGNMGRNSIRMSHYRNWDASLTKDIRITERQALKLSVQMQNVTNSVMYTIPYTGLTTSSLFGEMSGPSGIQNFNGARRMQVSARYTF